MRLSFASPWVDRVDPRGTTGEPTGGQPEGKWSSFDIPFFLAGEGSCLVLKMTSVDHGDLPTGFVRGSATGKVKNALPGSMVDVRK